MTLVLSRRKFIVASSALVGGAATASVLSTRASATAPTLNIALQNATTSGTVYAYITGQAIDNGNALFLLQADGRTPYYPSSPSSTGTPLGANCAIPLGAPGSTVNVTIPHIAGGRIWFSIGAPITFLLNPGPALVEPSVTNPCDPSINVMWDFCEFTYNNTAAVREHQLRRLRLDPDLADPDELLRRSAARLRHGHQRPRHGLQRPDRTEQRRRRWLEQADRHLRRRATCAR